MVVESEEFWSASETNDSESVTNMRLLSSGEQVLLLNICLFWGCFLAQMRIFAYYIWDHCFGIF